MKWNDGGEKLVPNEGREASPQVYTERSRSVRMKSRDEGENEKEKFLVIRDF